MHLIDALAAGVQGAASGTAFLYRRGTSTLVSYYGDYEGTNPLSQTSSGIALDEYGSAVVYVDDCVTVIVKNQGGSTVRTFTAGAKDAAVEVISQGFTGVDYTSGASGSSKPTTLQSVLDKWFTSAGTTDFKVMYKGVATNIQSAVRASIGIYNVRDEEYGAEGDGVTDDYAAIAAAIQEADTDGGGTVVLPPGTYLISDMLTLPPTVSLVGAGPECTHLQLEAATASGDSAVYLEGSAAAHFQYQRLSDMRITCSELNDNEAIRIGNPYAILENLYVAGDATNGFSSYLIDSVAVPTRFDLVVRDCTFEPASSSLGRVILLEAASSIGRLTIVDTRFDCGDVGSGYRVVDVLGTTGELRVANCVVDASGGTAAGYGFSTGGSMFIHGCHVIGSATGTMALMRISTIATSGGLLVESGNSASGTGGVLYAGIPAAALLDQLKLHSRALSYKTYTITSSTQTIDPMLHGVVIIEKTSGATLTVTPGTDNVPLGHRFTLTVWNNGTGGALTVTLGSGFKGTNWTVSDNNTHTADFIAHAGPGGTVHLYQVATATNFVE